MFRHKLECFENFSIIFRIFSHFPIAKSNFEKLLEMYSPALNFFLGSLLPNLFIGILKKSRSIETFSMV